MSNIEHKIYTIEDHIQLFKSFAESLKLPLTQIARTAELSAKNGSVDPLNDLSLAADNLNSLIEHYMLSLQLQSFGDELELTPVSIGATLQEVAHNIHNHAYQNSCDVELQLAGKYAPVMAHPKALQAALMSISQVLIDAQGEREPTKRQVIKLAAHRTRYGIVAGIFTDIDGLNTATLKRAKNLFGSVKQPLTQLTSATGAGVFVADSLLSTMTSGLRVAKYQKLNGLAATFSPSQQLALM